MAPPLLLNGFMGTGKSTVGRLVAERAGATFVDLDQAIEQRAGKSIARVFQEDGEGAFRRLEREELQKLLAEGSAAVIALGGGALLDRPFRVDVLGQATVVTLTAPELEILERVRSQDAGSNARPLLSGPAPEKEIARLLAQRSEAYAECHVAISTEGFTAEQVAERVLQAWREGGIAVAAGASSYRVLVGSDLVSTQLAGLIGRPSGVLLVSDETVLGLHGDTARAALPSGIPHHEAVLQPGEQYKNLQGLTRIFDAAYQGGLDRGALFIGLGGGVVTDMTGFAAATWVRGVRWIGLPTTLLSMVDASVGGKTAVDFENAKNAVGAFWQPSGVLCDVATLRTESERMFRGALSEVVKTALIGDPELLELLEERTDEVLARSPELLQRIVTRSVRVKARVVALDEREAGLRATLNLGHTIGHALESAGGYEQLTHGEAVSLGLVAALRYGRQLGKTPEELVQRTTRLLKRLGLPTVLRRQDLETASGLISHDKKRTGDAVRFVFATAPGQVMSERVPLSDLVNSAAGLADA